MIDDHSDTFIILCRTRTLREFRLSGLQQWTREKAIRGEEKTAKLPRVRSDGFQTLSWVCWGVVELGCGLESDLSYERRRKRGAQGKRRGRIGLFGI